MPVSATTDVAEGTIAPNLLNTVTGSISNFELENDEEQQWSVALKGDITEDEGTAAGTANGGEPRVRSAPPSTARRTLIHSPAPSVGEFGANFSNGSVAGAFGARK